MNSRIQSGAKFVRRGCHIFTSVHYIVMQNLVSVKNCSPVYDIMNATPIFWSNWNFIRCRCHVFSTVRNSFMQNLHRLVNWLNASLIPDLIYWNPIYNRFQILVDIVVLFVMFRCNKYRASDTKPARKSFHTLICYCFNNIVDRPFVSCSVCTNVRALQFPQITRIHEIVLQMATK